MLKATRLDVYWKQLIDYCPAAEFHPLPHFCPTSLPSPPTPPPSSLPPHTHTHTHAHQLVYVEAMVDSPLLSSGCVSWSNTAVSTRVMSMFTGEREEERGGGVRRGVRRGSEEGREEGE